MCHICRTGPNSANVSHLPHCRRIPTFMLAACLRGTQQATAFVLLTTNRRSAVMKVLIIAGATLAVVTAAGAADLPRRQPVYQEAPVGKMPIGKSPIGKGPLGKGPVVTRGY